MFRNILVAADDSADAAEALSQAIDLAESEHTGLTLITGIPELPAIAYAGLSADFAALDRDARSWAETVLARARDRVPDNLPVVTVLAEKPIRRAFSKRSNPDATT
jgi:nucleotide-binding universal stress UspA family protein